MTSNSRGIDYSKWDNIDVSSSEDDNDDNDDNNMPRVTTLSGPSTITRSADGTISAVDAPTATSADARITDNNSKSYSSSMGVSYLTKNGGHFIDAETKSYIFWSQERTEVNISVAFDPTNIQSKDISVKTEGVLPFSQCLSAVGGDATSKGSLLVQAKVVSSGRTVTLFSGNFPHFIHLPEGEESIDWEIESCEYFHGMFDLLSSAAGCAGQTKLVRITLLKAVPMAGVSLWWSHPLLHCPKTDVNAIGGRKGDRQDEIKAAWDEAHRMFREKMANKKGRGPHEIDV
mmetsp:Transcript_6808/g.9975  ORF Transcript_6808/g.9975 Transcript_6808/m.9975 type:complete len:288 (+) Transcript_6808:71-934(+)